jgi:hypothetical protein
MHSQSHSIPVMIQLARPDSRLRVDTRVSRASLKAAPSQAC